MKLLFYATEKNGFGKHLEQAIGEIKAVLNKMLETERR